MSTIPRTQDEADAENRLLRYTGIAWDRDTLDYIIWVDGRIAGWAKSPTDGYDRLNEARQKVAKRSW